MRPLLVLAVLLAGCAASAPDAPLDDTPEGAAADVVVLVSIDGFRHDYLDRPGVEAPTLRRIAAEGVRAERLVPVYPTKTFPNHYSLATGLTPAQHGIVGNTMWDASLEDADGRGGRFSLGNRDAVTDARWWGGEPIWVTAERQGVRAGTAFWPGSEAAVGGARPSRWLVYDGDMPYDARVDTVLAWIDRDGVGLATLYFEAVDDAGHRHGPDAPEVADAIARVDASLARFVAGLERRGLDAAVVVVSDHGMAALDPSRRILLDDAIDLEAEAEFVVWGEAAGVWPAAGVEAADLAARIDALDHVSATVRAAVPARYRFRGNDRIPPVVVMPDEGWSVSSQAYADRNPDRPSGGGHGFDNALPSMHGLFLASGPGIRAGRLETVSVLDVYGILARLLGVEAAPNEGDPAVVARVVE